MTRKKNVKKPKSKRRASNREISLPNSNIACTMKKVKRAKRITISVKNDRSVVITLPYWVPYSLGEQFAVTQEEWVQEKMEKLGQFGPLGTRDHFLKNKERARDLITKKVNQFNSYYNYTFSKIRIGNQRSRWGSCSSKGTLSFNYALVFLPEELIDYVVVHELCHLKELNHGKAFWKLVEETIPNYKHHAMILRTKKYAVSDVI